jgi:hypothetical protein
MPRTVLIADPDAPSRDRVATIAHEAGYRVLKARSPAETRGALDACPISAVVIDEELLRHFDLPRLLVRTQVVVLSKDRDAPFSEEVAVVHKDLSGAEMGGMLVACIGDPSYSGPRAVVPHATESPATDKARAGTT